jgi:hypothetical protein
MDTERKTWEEFREAKLLWWANRILQLFGWSIIFDYDEDENLLDVYPARSKFRGFDEETEADGFIGLTKYMVEHAEELQQEVEGTV